MSALSVIKNAADRERAAGAVHYANRIDEAHAAVVELIEADKEFNAALDAYRDALPDGLGASLNLREDHPAVIRLREAGSRRRVALARVQGGA